MGDALRSWIIISISVVLLSTLVAAMSWTFVIGLSIASAWQDEVVTYYSEAGLSMMVDSNNVDDIDAANLYKVLEVNRNIITGYVIKNIDGTFVHDTKELLNRPADRFSVIIRGDSAIGFEVTVQQVTKIIGGGD